MKAEQAVAASMASHHMHDSPHLKLTAKQPVRPGDRERAAAIVAAINPALARYRDYHVALQNGYELFMPEIPQAIYHFANYFEDFAESRRFQPDQATALLYLKTATGYDLVGAMYTARKRASEDDVNTRVPLSVARWHKHVNFCLPPRGTPASEWDLKKFGATGSINTEEACKAVDGRFYPQVFGWMVHVYPYRSDPAKIWAH